MNDAPLGRLTGDVTIRPTADELYDVLAEELSACVWRAVQERGVAHVALSGGSTPEPFYMRLIIDPRYRQIPWSSVHLWMVDERRMPEHHPQSNFRMIRESLADHLPQKRHQVHPMPVMQDDADDAYARDLAEWIPDGRLDFVLLGMGDDAHTASLFPRSPALDVNDRPVAINAGPTVTPPERVTLTYPMLNAARTVAVLVVGEQKHQALKQAERQLATQGPDPRNLPITGVRPTDGEMTWYLDAAAAGISTEPERIELA